MTAALSVAVLLGAAGWQVSSFMSAGTQALAFVATAPAAQTASAAGADWQQEMAILGLATTTDPSATSTSDSIALIGPMVAAEMAGAYAGLQSQGTASPQAIQAASANIASNIRAVLTYKTYTVSDIQTDPNTSYARMLTYRADLRAALAPLLQNTNSELELYGKYVETNDTSYLTQLSAAAQNYRAAAQNSAAVVVPIDAVNYQKDILNAMQEFAAALDGLATHGTDPLASAALLRAYNQAEQDMYTSFNNLASYYSQKTP
jgi:hypothetical protein